MTLLVEHYQQDKTITDIPFVADNKDTFRKYKGVEILIEMLKEYKTVVVAKTLTHVISGNGKPTSC